MAKTYCTCQGMRGQRTARGGASEGVTASVQSYDGSVITSLHYNEKGELIFKLGIADGSSSYEDKFIFIGTIEELCKKLGV